MSLTIGTLTGFINLDTSQFDAGLDDAAGKMKGFGGKGAALAATAGLAIGTAIAGGVLGGMNVEAANDKLAAQMRLTEAESEAIGKTAGKLYAGAYGSSLDEVNSALRGLMQNVDGMSATGGAALERMGVKALDLAAIMGEDVSLVTRGVGQLMRNGMAKDATQAFDIIAAASAKTGATMQGELLETIEEYGADFRELGLTGPQAMGAITAAVDAGARNLDLAADAFREFSDIMIEGGERPAEALKSIGLNAGEMQKAIAGGGPAAAQATSDIIRALNGVDDKTKQNTAGLALFGTKWLDAGATAVLAMDPLAATLDNTTGAMDQMSASLNDNATASLTSLKRQAELAVVGLANGLLPAVNNAASAAAAHFGPALGVAAAAAVALIGVVKGATGVLSEHQTTTKVLAGVILTLMVPTLVGLATGYATTAKAAAVSAATQSAAWLRTQVQALATGVVLAATFALTVAGWVASAVAATASGLAIAAAWLLALGPAGLVIAAIAALAAGIVIAWKHSETFRNVVKAAFSVALTAVSGFLGGIESMLRALGKIPGFGWADTAANKVAGARASVDGLNASLNRIPANVSTTITTRYVVVGEPSKSVRGGVTERASGGPVSPFGSYLVGEHGPELLTMGSFGGQITPAGATRDALAGAGGGGKHFHLTVTARETVNVQDEFHRMELLAG